MLRLVVVGAALFAPYGGHALDPEMTPCLTVGASRDLLFRVPEGRFTNRLTRTLKVIARSPWSIDLVKRTDGMQDSDQDTGPGSYGTSAVHRGVASTSLVFFIRFFLSETFSPGAQLSKPG